MTAKTLLLLALILAAAAPAEAWQGARSAHDSKDPKACKTCSKAIDAAVKYIDSKTEQDSPLWNFSRGWVYLAQGDQAEKVQRAADYLSERRVYADFSFNKNWMTGFSALFLSEIYRRQPSDKLKETLLDIVKVAEQTMEPTGGWCHEKGFSDRIGYAGRGGGQDLGTLTCIFFSAFLNMKQAGIAVPEKLLAAVQKNLEGLSDGMGVVYGTGNGTADVAMGRGSWAWLGIHAAQHKKTKLFATIPKGLRTRFKATDQGHAFAPLHFMGVALASHLLGPDAYEPFWSHWADALIARQQADGSVELPHKEAMENQKADLLVSSTSAFALILLLRQPGLLQKGLPSDPAKPGKK